MDAGVTPPVGYHRWRAIRRAMTVLGIDAGRWQAIGRQVALAWAIQSEVRPRQAMHNTPTAPERLATLRTHWLARSDDEIDAAFALGPGIGSLTVDPGYSGKGRWHWPSGPACRSWLR